MNTLKTITCGLLVASACMVLAQGGKNIRPVDPELLAKHERAGAARDRGREFLKNDQLEEAIAAFRESIEIEITYGHHVSIGNYELAKALTAAARTEEALAAYKKAVRWHPGRKDLETNGPPFILIGMDYAILLAKSGKDEEAKAVYYWTLRTLNRARGSHEPFPFLVVFDLDPDMVFWEYSTERLIAAAMMLRAPDSGQNARSLAEEVRMVEPTWVVPVVYLAFRSSNERRDVLLDQALGLAMVGEEKEWVSAYIEAVQIGDQSERMQRLSELSQRLAETGVAQRKASTVLIEAKLDLERNHDKIAVCECEGGH